MRLIVHRLASSKLCALAATRLYWASMDYRRGNLTKSRLTLHLVWITKYRYYVLKGDVQSRCRELLIQVCEAEDVRILKGVLSKDHIHMHLEYPPSLAISDLVKRLKGRSSRKLQ